MVNLLLLQSAGKVERRNLLRDLNADVNSRSSISEAECMDILKQLPFEDDYDMCRELSFRIVRHLVLCCLVCHALDVAKPERQ